MADRRGGRLGLLLEAALRRDALVTLGGVLALTALAWLYLARLGREMAEMAQMGMVDAGPWTLADAGLATIMWAVMMTAMMLPSAAPMILVFASLERKRREGAAAGARTAVFVLGYLAIWTGFSVVAAGGQWALRAGALLADDTLRLHAAAGGVVLIVAGVYQITPLKYACLARCRTPIGFLLSEWREGRAGAFAMGVRHGVFCVGCCWVLMALLFVGGVMNLAWVAAIAAFVLAEKLVPAGRALSAATAALLIAWGVWLLVRAG